MLVSRAGVSQNASLLRREGARGQGLPAPWPLACAFGPSDRLLGLTEVNVLTSRRLDI